MSLQRLPVLADRLGDLRHGLEVSDGVGVLRGGQVGPNAVGSLVAVGLTGNK